MVREKQLESHPSNCQRVSDTHTPGADDRFGPSATFRFLAPAQHCTHHCYCAALCLRVTVALLKLVAGFDAQAISGPKLNLLVALCNLPGVYLQRALMGRSYHVFCEAVMSAPPQYQDYCGQSNCLLPW
eukprot:488687-Pelagomonas_calceolata.AAC.1